MELCVHSLWGKGKSRSAHCYSLSYGSVQIFSHRNIPNQCVASFELSCRKLPLDRSRKWFCIVSKIIELREVLYFQSEYTNLQSAYI